VGKWDIYVPTDILSYFSAVPWAAFQEGNPLIIRAEKRHRKDDENKRFLPLISTAWRTEERAAAIIPDQTEKKNRTRVKVIFPEVICPGDRFTGNVNADIYIELLQKTFLQYLLAVHPDIPGIYKYQTLSLI
jgi:hypothetical protein